MEYNLIKVKPTDQDLIFTFYEWEKNEAHRERYTCRPVKEIGSYKLSVLQNSIFHRFSHIYSVRNINGTLYIVSNAL